MAGRIRDKILRRARLERGCAVLDVGTGDGFLAFGALASVPESRAVLADISASLLKRCRTTARRLGLSDRCRFVLAPAEALTPIPDTSVDAVVMRSVLVHVAAKRRAFLEFFRVLRPGGRLSLAEAINRGSYPEPRATFWGYDVSPVAELACALHAFYHRRIPPHVDPMVDFDERDLVALAASAGFAEIHLEYRLAVGAPPPHAWAEFAATVWNPRAPSLAEAMRATLTAAQRARFVRHLRPLVEAGHGTRRVSVAYVRAVRPV